MRSFSSFPLDKLLDLDDELELDLLLDLDDELDLEEDDDFFESDF